MVTQLHETFAALGEPHRLAVVQLLRKQPRRPADLATKLSLSTDLGTAMSDVTTFQKYAGNFGDYSFLILFVKSDVDSVAEAYSKATGQRLIRDVEVMSSDETPYGPIGGVVAVAGSDWTILFHRLGQWEDFDSSLIAHATESDTLVFQAEDTSGSMGCELIVPGKPLRRFYIQSDADTEVEYCEMREREPPPYEIIESYPALFRSLGISTVEPYCKEDRSVVASPDDVERIERFHFVGDTPWV